MKKRCLTALTTGLMILGFCNLAPAVTLSFTDPVGDNSGIVDVVNMDMNIDEVTGYYTIDILADNANPFTGDFRININLFNVTQDEYFQDAFNDYALGSSTLTAIQLTGTNPTIKDWLLSDTYATTSLQGLGMPAGTSAFRTSVANLPFEGILVSEDIIGFDDKSSSPVPEPATILLMGTGLAGLIGARRKKNA